MSRTSSAEVPVATLFNVMFPPVRPMVTVPELVPVPMFTAPVLVPVLMLVG